MTSTHFATVAAVVIAFLIAATVVRIAQAIVHRLLDALEIVGTEQREAMQLRARQLTRALTFLAYGVAALASVSMALARFGVNEARWDPRTIAHWGVTHG